MAFDGMVVAGLVRELDAALSGGHVGKIAQPEKDALVLTIKKDRNNHKLYLSASAGLPLAYLTETTKAAPQEAPGVCMLLRKHLGGAKILSVTQPGLERVMRIKMSHLDEMGDLGEKTLVLEIMGKYSNIILLDENERVVDSIKRVSLNVSSVREILPGKEYFIPEQKGRVDPISATDEYFLENALAKPSSLAKAIANSYVGFSTLLAVEICTRAGLDADTSTAALTEGDKLKLLAEFRKIIATDSFDPRIYYENDGSPLEFSPFPLETYADKQCEPCPSFSKMLEEFYGAKEGTLRIRQRSVELRRIVDNAIERTANKLSIFEKQLKDTEKRDKFKRYGDLITTYGYQLSEGAKELVANDFETGAEVRVPLDPTIPVMANAKKYFDRYAKLKRTNEAVISQKAEAEAELLHLQSVKASLEIAEGEGDLAEIRRELSDQGYVRKRRDAGGKKRKPAKSKPLHFVSSDGFDVYVGKNNYQNDELTFKLAEGRDWWFHAKKRPGSHVVLVTGGRDIPDRAFLEAAKLAVHFSSAGTDAGSGTYEVDYVQKKEVKKPNGAKPGFVVYYTNYSMMADGNIDGLKEVE